MKITREFIYMVACMLVNLALMPFTLIGITLLLEEGLKVDFFSLILVFAVPVLALMNLVASVIFYISEKNDHHSFEVTEEKSGH